MAVARKPKFDPRKLMEQTIAVMRNSVPEARSDGRTNPLVGALIWKPDGSIETACRAELRDGDHAEFTLLERKNRSVALDGSILFATLEPCAPGARRHPKLGCAERVVLARIKQVWVGIEDPDPTVDRKGIKYLQDHGVDVRMFDRDLQDAIKSENQTFMDEATARARAAAVPPPEVVLSSLEAEQPDAALGDLLPAALEEFRSRAGIDDAVATPAFRGRLRDIGLLEERGGVLRPTGFGFLLFGKKPRRAMPQAGVLARIEYANGQIERKEFDEPLVLIPERVEQWLRDKAPNLLDRSEMRRKEAPTLPFELIREGIVNALIHRDYDVAGAKVQLVVNENTVTISSPGRPPAPITMEQLQSLRPPMLSRNPPLHYVFARMELAEEMGLGIHSMKTRAEKGGLPLPRYSWNDPYVVLTLYRNAKAAIADLPAAARAFNADDRAAWELISTREAITARELAVALSFDERKSQRVLRKLTTAGLLRQTGRGRATRFEVVRR